MTLQVQRAVRACVCCPCCCWPTRPGIRFIDIAAQAGLTIPNTFGGKDKKDFILESTGTGAAIFDYNGDGANDIFIANGTTLDPNAPPTRSQLYRNDGKGHFTEVGQQAGLTRTGWAQAACVGDFDNDGHPDLLVTYYGHNSLYRNRGDGKFADVTAAGRSPRHRHALGLGLRVHRLRSRRLPGYLRRQLRRPRSRKTRRSPEAARTASGREWWSSAARADCPWRTTRSITTTATARLPTSPRRPASSRPAAATASAWSSPISITTAGPISMSPATRPPACSIATSTTARSKSAATRRASPTTPTATCRPAWASRSADYDGNGFLDIAKTNFSGDRPSLYKNEDGKFFEDVSEPSGLGRNQLLGWGIAFLDIDEDGWPDLVMANGHVYPEIDRSPVGETYRQKTLLYRNLGNGRFADVTASAGPGFAPARPSRGLATGDLDGDGRPEILIVNMNDRPTLLKNVGPEAERDRDHADRHAVQPQRHRRAMHRRSRTAASRSPTWSAAAATIRRARSRCISASAKRRRSIASRCAGRPAETQSWTNVLVNRTVRITEGRSELEQVPFPGMPVP